MYMCMRMYRCYSFGRLSILRPTFLAVKEWSASSISISRFFPLAHSHPLVRRGYRISGKSLESPAAYCCFSNLG
ncbi:hypothetical protein EMPG_12756 [Blastomyces silverae]|uniref:Uncharacterized protein n=1 Tax=Blastomyces silverae TaxID=2060906 RepID=A0A0H1BSI9_9EURO|nr:hypothetical protein EMPG_12756 [Blastomyces silverae]